MNKFKKALVAAGVSAAMLGTGFIGTTSAFATVTTEKDITFSNYTNNDVVTAYRILNIESEGNDGALVYSVNSANRTALIAGLTNGLKLTVAEDATDSDLIKLVTANLKDSNVDDFAEAFFNATPTSAASVTLTADTSTLSVQEGYYLIDHTTIGNTTKDTKSRYMVTNVASNGASVELKNGTVTLVKKVQDNGDTGDVQGTNWNDSADYNIGDTVPFQLTGTLPDNWDDYTNFYYEFVDTISAGFTLNGDFVVKIDDQVVTTNFTKTTSDNAQDQNATDISLKTTDLKAITKDDTGADLSIKKTSKVVVTYSATLNDKAVIGTAGNPNVAALKFANNPYVNGTGDAGDTNTGTTPEDKVKVFTYELQGTKTFTPDPNENDLPVFTLYRGSVADANKVGTSNVVKNQDGTYSFGFQGLDAGTYVLVETYTPAGFNTAANVTFTITATHSETDDDPTCVLSVTGATLVADKGAAVTVANKGGSQLPSTGGMGTTILYTVGGLIVLAAAAGLTIALRKRNA